MLTAKDDMTVRTMVPNGRTLITGGSGFIGEHLALRLRGLNQQLVNLDLFESRTGSYHSQILGDIRDAQVVRRAARGCDTIIHLAAAHHDSGITERTFYDVNVGGAEAVAMVCRDEGIASIIFTSSVAVYGSDQSNTSEQGEPTPDTPYGRTKLLAEGVFRDWHQSVPGSRLIIVRPAVVFGENNFANMYSLMRQIHRRRFLLVGPGKNKKSIVYVQNLVSVLVNAMRLVQSDEMVLFNAADKPDMTSAQIAAVLASALGRTISPFHVPAWPAVTAAGFSEWLLSLVGVDSPLTAERVRKFAIANTQYPADRMHGRFHSELVPIEDSLRKVAMWFLETGRHLPVQRRIPPETWR